MYNELMSIAILIHVVIAILSIGIASLVFFVPSIKKLAVSYGFIVATVATGTYLLILNPNNMLHTCLSGLFYLTLISVITIATHVRARKLAKENI